MDNNNNNINSRKNTFDRSEMVCTKTLYNYIVKNIDLPYKLRRNIKPARVRKNKKILGSSISERPYEIDSRDEFGHWEITVRDEKSSDDNVLLIMI